MLDRLTEVFCEVDDFCQAFDAQWQSYLIGSGAMPRGPKPGLSVSKIITLLLVLHGSGFKYHHRLSNQPHYAQAQTSFNLSSCDSCLKSHYRGWVRNFRRGHYRFLRRCHGAGFGTKLASRTCSSVQGGLAGVELSESFILANAMMWPAPYASVKSSASLLWRLGFWASLRRIL